MTDTSSRPPTVAAGFLPALPFWLSLVFVPLILWAALAGGWAILGVPIYAWIVISLLDRATGLNRENADPDSPEEGLFWYRFVTMIWLPVQLFLIGFCIWAGTSGHLGRWEAVALMAALGTATGGVGINYAHELMHQRNRLERRLGEWLMISVLYGHFVSEHLLVHHRYVGTPRDPVTARYNESVYGFLARVLPGSLVSAWKAEAAMLARKDLPVWSRQNPFWRYGLGGLLFLAIAGLIGGWFGVLLFLVQAAVAILQLEMVNYVEHYGLTRKHLGEGKYEPAKPRHSWNASHRFSNYLLINLQRHSDHHFKPSRRFPVLQTYSEEEAPQLPYGYPLMIMISANPLWWRRMMNPRVRAWRKQFYPEITDWTPYKDMRNPLPR
ncbi:alkane 1-monooxygenase [Oceanomicrobium pacificus]|uniref:Alkane 1-monooxygenase n=1 Tax=Oceanomicrobium pacificus TaxID=2692916 RepID=A0A6B0TLS3_9RHOB|nr:alkane 1-monooxygenase [Oceanomicrobium pacificus]MXU64846.1 alkane 1-monooxygenase [Oceanomicrobium pacificus]